MITQALFLPSGRRNMYGASSLETILITVVLHPLMCKENIATKKNKTEKCGEANRLQSGEQDRKRAPMFFLERTHIIAKCYILHGHSITLNAIC